MIARGAAYLALAGGLAFLALVLVIMSAVSLKMALVFIPALAIGGLVLIHPFAGLVLLVLFAQLDAVANLISQSLPISLYKLLTLATLGGFGLMSWRTAREDRLGARSVELKLALLFALTMMLSLLLADFKAQGLSHLIGFVSSMLLMFLIYVLVDSPAKLETLLWVLIAAGLVSSLIVLAETLLGIRLLSTSDAAATAQYEGQARSAGASDYNPTTAAHMLLVTVVIAGVMLFESRRLRLLSGFALLVGVPALVLTLARSAAIAFGVIVLIYAWRNRKRRFFPLILLCTICAIVAALPFIPEVYWQRMATMINPEVDRTLLRRVSYNLIGLDLLAQHPVLGVGPGNFPSHYAGLDYRWYPGREPLPRQLHNSYLEVAAETGLVGVALFLGAVLGSLRRGIEAAQARIAALSPLALAASYGFGAFLIASVFMPNEDTKFMWILPGLCIAAAQLAHRPAPQQQGA